MRIDLRTKIVDPAQQIWVVFPGRRRRFFEEFKETSRLFLELPGLGLSNALREDGSFDDHELLKRVKRSMSYGTYEDSLRAGNPIEVPADQLNQYHVDREDGRVRTMFGCVNGLFQRMKAGDLVVVPGKGAYGEVLFGEVEGNFSRDDNIQFGRFGDHSINTRRVRWIKNISERRELPRHIARHLERPPAVHQIQRSLKNDRVFGVAYESYMTHATAETIIRAPEYSGKNPLETLSFQRLLAALTAVYFAKQEGIDPAQIEEMTLDSFTNRYLPDEAFLEYQFSFASPGFVRARPRLVSLAVFLTAAVPLALAGINNMADGESIFVTNSAGELSPEIEQDVRESLEFMKATMAHRQTQEIDSMAEQSKEQLDISSSAILEDEEDEPA